MILHNTGKMLMCIFSWLTQILVTFSVDSPPISGISIRKIRQHISQLLMSNTSLIVWSAVLLRMVTIFLDTTSSNIDQIAKSKCKLHWTERKFFVSEKIHSFLKPLMQIPRHQNLVGIGYIYRIDHIRCWNLNPNIYFFHYYYFCHQGFLIIRMWTKLISQKKFRAWSPERKKFICFAFYGKLIWVVLHVGFWKLG